jgi:leucyl aminopeptidase
MTNLSSLIQPDRDQPARTVERVTAKGFDGWFKALPPRARIMAEAAQFKAKPGEIVRLAGDNPDDWLLAYGAAEDTDLWELAGVVAALSPGTYRLAHGDPKQAALGWLLGHYRFNRYKPKAEPLAERILLTPAPASIDEHVRLATATALVRDLVNTPAADLGPAELEQYADALAKQYGATLDTVKADELSRGYPMIHAVGQAAVKGREPRLINLQWGNPAHPRIAIIGKGIIFDTGGLNLKPGSSMRLMKKDMGGAAHALALAQLVMSARLPVRMQMLLPVAENAIAGNAFRPGDVLATRAGLTVEIDNTDAEGRLVLGDALTRAGEEAPALIIDFATLTGAARSALGPELPATFVNDEQLAAELITASVNANDPLWRMPLWAPYGDMLKSDIADIANSSDSGMAGAVTAALFLQKFVPANTPWAHLDTFAWQPASKPGRPKGGEALGLRACYTMLKARYPIVHRS